MSEEEKKCLEHLEGKNSRIVIEDEECKIFEEGTEPPKFILGFTGAGLVGTIVTNELIKQMDMRQIGYVLSEDLPPITIFYEGILKHPFRLYYSDEQNILVSICEIPFVSGAYSDISRTLMDFALKNGIKDIICVQGLADKSFLPNEKEVKIFAAGEKKAMDRLDKYDLNKPPKGIIVGAEAAILNECLNNRLDGVVFLTPANPQIPSPEGAAGILEKMNEVYGFSISTEDLVEQSNEIKKRLLELAQKSNQIHKQQEQGQGQPRGGRLYS